jgi:hypothetical protein
MIQRFLEVIEERGQVQNRREIPLIKENDGAFEWAWE